MIDPTAEAETLREFRRRRIMSVGELAERLGCSIPTVRSRLKSWGALTSYNRNGRYYALAEVASFDESGLWKHKGAYFSRYGTLKRTMRSLAAASEAGLDTGQMGRLVGLPPRTFATQLGKISGLRREKAGTGFVYYSDEEDSYRSQRVRRKEESVGEPRELPLDTEAIFILVDRIRHPDSSVQQCVRGLRRGGRRVSVAAVRSLLAHHGIEKKTTDTGSS